MQIKKLGGANWFCIGICVLGAAALYRLEASHLPYFDTIFSKHTQVHEYAGRAIGLSQQGAAIDSPALYILGTSVVRQSLWQQAIMQRELASRNADLFKYVDLNTPGQRPVETLFLAYLSQPSPGDQYYYFVSPITFTFSLEENFERLNGRLYHADPTSFFQQILSERLHLPDEFLISEHYSLAQFSAYLVNKGILHFSNKLLFSGSRPVYQRYSIDHDVDSPQWQEAWKNVSRKKTAAMSRQENIHHNLAVVKALEGYLSERGATLHLLAAPIPENGVSSDYLQVYQEIHAQVCDGRQNFSCIDLNPMTRLDHSDFNDPVHTNASGRNIWSRVFVDYLAGQPHHEH
ncbi:MAG: hypothetical protein ACFE0K_01455 [Alcanivorax sp.]|uniref:hypothetical protein n=1 Tax=Alcanivorax sp. TaxID=1872427 RepID=UPI003DA77106